MKELFANFYKWEHYQEPSIDELKLAWESDKTIFIFDTNILLGLYEKKTQQEIESFFSILEKLESRIWLPYQVAFEFFQRNKEIQKKEQGRLLNELKIDMESHNKIINSVEKRKGDFSESSQILSFLNNIEKLHTDMRNSMDGYNKEIETYINNTIKPFHDNIFKKIGEHFTGKVGEDFSEIEREKIYIEGDKRYQNGFTLVVKDNRKGEKAYFLKNIEYKRKYGDFIAWKQIIKKVQNEKYIENVFFIADDEDWLQKQNRKTHPDLVKEILLESDNVKLFHVYNFDLFIKYGSENLNLGIDEELLNQINKKEENLYYLEEEHRRKERYRKKVPRAFRRIREKDEQRLAEIFYQNMPDYEFYKQCRLEELADEYPNLSWEELEVQFEWDEKFWSEWDK